MGAVQHSGDNRRGEGCGDNRQVYAISVAAFKREREREDEELHLQSCSARTASGDCTMPK